MAPTHLAEELESLAHQALYDRAGRSAYRRVRALTPCISDRYRSHWWRELLACLEQRARQDAGLLEPPGDYEPDWTERVDEALAELLDEDPNS